MVWPFIARLFGTPAGRAAVGTAGVRASTLLAGARNYAASILTPSWKGAVASTAALATYNELAPSDYDVLGGTDWTTIFGTVATAVQNLVALGSDKAAQDQAGIKDMATLTALAAEGTEYARVARALALMHGYALDPATGKATPLGRTQLTDEEMKFVRDTLGTPIKDGGLFGQDSLDPQPNTQPTAAMLPFALAFVALVDQASVELSQDADGALAAARRYFQDVRWGRLPNPFATGRDIKVQAYGYACARVLSENGHAVAIPDEVRSALTSAIAAARVVTA